MTIESGLAFGLALVVGAAAAAAAVVANVLEQGHMCFPNLLFPPIISYDARLYTKCPAWPPGWDKLG